ncbi:hypothetical protein [Sphingobium xanthum]|jgi:hypothetical protein|uniref:hypothetical protein n=1 Tax=Sphingobium xanthum TaxID=1387165 RepID=UPI001C8B8CCA|nr:hypothetical protein [Sphingobium xanthum]
MASSFKTRLTGEIEKKKYAPTPELSELSKENYVQPTDPNAHLRRLSPPVAACRIAPRPLLCSLSA